jgi:adenylate cyclase
MERSSVERKLAVILSADVAGYSRLMGEDEERTLNMLRSYRNAIDGLIAAHRGRVFGSAGDSVVAEFASPVQALRCAMEIQEEVGRRNAELSPDRRMRFRIGVNLGDVIVEGENLYGDGINVAARLQELAEPGAICLSGTLFDQVKRKVATDYEDLGAKTVKNIAEPVHVYRIASGARRAAENQRDIARSSADVHDDRPSIAVLPFVDMSPDRDQDYLCEGLAEELINVLTNIDGLRVAARTASFQFRAAGADVREVGNRLGVATLLEGSVRKAADRLRITVQLVDVATGYHRWSQRFDRTLDDIFAIQDEIAESVATALCGSVLSRRDKEALQRPQTSVEAYEYYLRGLQHLPRLTRADLETSREMFERAIELDADYGPAWAGLAMVHATLYEWFGAEANDLSRAEQTSRRALEVAPSLAESHVARGFALSLSRHYDEARKEFEDAIRINANLFDAYYYYARTAFAHGNAARSAELFRKAADVRREDFQSPMLLAQSLRMIGRMEEAREADREGIRRAEHILALNPSDRRALSLGSLSLFEDGQTERALEWSRRSLELDPEDMSALINSACLHAKAGLKEEALEFLERSFARGWGKRDWVEHDPDYDILRDDPRFKTLLSRLK